MIGPVALELTGLRKVIRVETAIEMNEAVNKAGPFDIACAAAVSDWRPKESKTKIKKKPMGGPQFLELIENPDILKYMFR